jgi:hypothetical protein
MPDRRPGGFEPMHSAHAIEQLAITVQVARPIGRQNIAEADKALSISALPKRTELRVMVAFGPIPAQQPQGGALGYLFQRFQSDGSVEAEVRIEQHSFVFRTFHYTRWATIWREAKSYFEKFLPIYLGSIPPSAIGLTFVDKFVWHGQPDEARAKALLRVDSPYLATWLPIFSREMTFGTATQAHFSGLMRRPSG